MADVAMHGPETQPTQARSPVPVGLGAAVSVITAVLFSLSAYDAIANGLAYPNGLVFASVATLNFGFAVAVVRLRRRALVAVAVTVALLSACYGALAGSSI